VPARGSKPSNGETAARGATKRNCGDGGIRGNLWRATVAAVGTPPRLGACGVGLFEL